MTRIVKRSKKQKIPLDDGQRTPKRYFFTTGFSIPPTWCRTGWMPRPEWETLNDQDRLRLKSRIPSDSPYNASIRTRIPDSNPHINERSLQRCANPHFPEKVYPTELTTGPDCSVSYPTELTTGPDCSVSAPVPAPHKEWRVFKEEDREDDEYHLKVPAWTIATDGKFICTACKRVFVKRTTLTRHFRMVHGEPRGGLINSELEEHVRRFADTPNGQITCKKCGQIFGRKAGFEGHWRRQHAVKHEAFDTDQETLQFSES